MDGSFITEAHVVAAVGAAEGGRATASYWAAELNRENWGWQVVNGTCGGRVFRLGPKSRRQCGALSIVVDLASATVSLGNWTLGVHGNHVFNRLSGPAHRLDLTFSAKGDAAARGLPHGIIGQSFSSTAPRFGKVDEYPEEGHFRTTAMAEGAIEGEAAMYEVASPHATEFTFSRFHAPKHKASVSPALVAALEASASD